MWHVVPVNESVSEGKSPATKRSREPTGLIDSKTLQQSFTAPSLKQGQSASSWSDLCCEVKKVADFRDVAWTPDSEDVGNVRPAILLLAAVKVNNQELISQLLTHQSVSRYIDSHTGDIDLSRLIFVCLETVVTAWCEDLACDLLELLKSDIPLHLVHRAGERGFTRFLTCLVRYNIPVKPNRVISNLPLKVQALLGRKLANKFQRFPARNRFVTDEEVLRWAVLTTGKEGIKVMLKKGHSFDPETIAKVLLSEGYPELLHEVLSPDDISKLSTRMKCLSRKTPKALRSYQVIAKLISLISDPTSSLSALFLLTLVRKPEWNQPEVELAYETLTWILLSEDVETTLISNHCNPLLLCIAMSEFSEKVSGYSLQLRERFLKLSLDFLHLAEHIQIQYEDYRSLQVIYLEKTYGSQCLFDVITKNTEKYRVLLKSDVVAAIVKDLWTGGDSVGFNFDHLSAVNEYFDEYETSIFKIHRIYAKESLPKCIFQLYYWKKNGSLRFIIETFMFLVLFGILVSQTVLYLSIVKIFEDPSLSYQMDQARAQMKVQGQLTNFIVASSGAVVLKIFQQIAYKNILKEPFSFSFADLISCVFFLSVFTVNILSQNSISAQMEFSVNQNVQEYLYATMMFTICLRISAILTQTRMFGPWIRMIFVIVKDIVVFLIIYLLAVMSFAMTYVMLFRHDADYFGSIQISIRTLFQWSVGGIDSSIFTFREELGSVLAIVWGFVSTVILLNLLIAVLSSRFDELSPQVTADYVSLIYRSYTQTRYEPPFGALVIMPAPFNILSFPLVFVYSLCPSAGAKLDRFFVILSYQIMFISGSILFLSYNLAVSVIAYFYVFGQLMKSLSIKAGIEMAMWLAAGPVYMWYLVFVSYCRFVKEMYREPEAVEDSIPNEVLIAAKNFVEKICGKTREKVTISQKDVETAIAKFPRIKANHGLVNSVVESFEKRNDSFRQVAERIYFSKSQLTNERSRRIFEFFSQFRSYSQGDSLPTINLTRMSYFMIAYFHRPSKLEAINIFYVQKAIMKLRTECKSDEK